MKNLLLSTAVICVVLVVACGTPASTNLSQSAGGLIEELTLDELAARADSILVGEVVDITSYQEGEGNIYTLVTLSVEQAIKGESEGEEVIRVPGGELGGQTLWVEDAPSFEPGERAVVFLEEIEGAFGVCGWHQGKFTIDNNNMVSGNITLTEFIDQIRDILANQ